MKNTFRALAGRDFRLYFFGQCVSLIGTWVQQVAFGWIAYRVTGSVFMLGLIAFSGQIPSLVLSPFSTLLTDRFSRRSVLIALQVVQMTLAGGLAVLAFMGDISPWVLVLASLVLGVAGVLFAVLGLNLNRRLPELRAAAHPVLRAKGLLPT